MENVEKSRFILGIAKGASLSEIKRAYRTKVKIWHPDLFHHDSKLRGGAEEKIKEINEARRVLLFFAQNDGSAQRQAKNPNANAAYRYHPGQRATTRSQDASTLMRCTACGQMNSLSPERASHFFLCHNCKKPLRQSKSPGILSLTSSPKTFRFGKRVFNLPSLDYVKFLIFCTCAIAVFTFAGLGMMILLWTGTGIVTRLLGRFFL